MLSRFSQRRTRRTHRAFSLVEVALSLGIAGFVLAGLIGAIPLAANTSGQSIAQTRATSIASTIFTILRTQPFSAVSYLDDGTTLNLDVNTVDTAGSTSSVTFYAYFDEATSTAPASNIDERRLHFVASVPASATAYQIKLHFDNHPAGTLKPSPHAQANAVEVSVNAVTRPRDVYRFSSVIANRSE